MYLLKKSSTGRELLFFMASSVDHVTAVTGIVPVVTLRKASGSFASPAGAITEIANGWYKVAGNATDTNTLGPLVLHATGTGADAMNVVYDVGLNSIADAVWSSDRVSDSTPAAWGADTFGEMLGIRLDAIRFGTAQTGTSSTITLSSGSNANNNFYISNIIRIVSGTGVGQSRRITGYAGSTKIATVTPNWVTNPDNTSVFAIFPSSGVVTGFDGNAGDELDAHIEAAIIGPTQLDAISDAVWGANSSTDSVGANWEPDSQGFLPLDSFTKLLARLGVFTGTGVNTVLGFFKALLSKTASTPSDVGGTFSATTDSTEAIRDRGDAAWITSSPGVGAFVVTITVKDGSAVAIQNASVRLTEGLNSFTALTNASGVATFGLDAATYSLTITKAGYAFTPTSIVVSASANFNEVMTTNAISSPAPTLCTVYDDLVFPDGSPAVGVSIQFTLVTGNLVVEDGSLIANNGHITVVTDSNGHFEQDLLRTDLLTPATLFYKVNCHQLGISNRIIKTTGAVLQLRAILE